MTEPFGSTKYQLMDGDGLVVCAVAKNEKTGKYEMDLQMYVTDPELAALLPEMLRQAAEHVRAKLQETGAIQFAGIVGRIPIH
jgi:hypothetical protein